MWQVPFIFRVQVSILSHHLDTSFLSQLINIVHIKCFWSSPSVGHFLHLHFLQCHFNALHELGSIEVCNRKSHLVRDKMENRPLDGVWMGWLSKGNVRCATEWRV